MLSHARLAERQGLLTGDLNPIQRACLLFVMDHERQAAREQDRLDLFKQVVALNPDKAQQIFASFYGSVDRLDDEFVDAVADEGGFSEDDMAYMLEQIKSQGFAVD